MFYVYIIIIIIIKTEGRYAQIQQVIGNDKYFIFKIFLVQHKYHPIS